MAANKRLRRTLRKTWGVVLGVLVSCSGWAMEPEKLFSMLSPSIMIVYAYLPDGTINYGSAVTIGHGKLLTNCHVLRKAQRIAIRHENVTYAAKLVAHHSSIFG